MTGHTHTVAEWLAMTSIASSGYAAFSAFYFLLVDAELADFDPRPALSRAVESGHQVAVHAGHDLNRAIATGQRVGHRAAACAKHAPRHAAISTAALLMLLTSSAPEATR